MAERNAELAAALGRDERHAYEIAALAQIHPTTLTGITAGRVVPAPAVRARLASVLGVAEEDIFGDLLVTRRAAKNVQRRRHTA